MLKQGFTLIELIVCLTIITIISGIAYPRYISHIKLQEANKFRQLSLAITQAQNSAFSTRNSVVICGSSDAVNCNGLWSKGWLVFVDNNHNRLFDNNETQINYFHLNSHYGEVKWKAALHHPIIAFEPVHGYALGYNGTMFYCGPTPQYNRVLIIDKLGSVRHGSDSNNNGIEEDRSGNDLITC